MATSNILGGERADIGAAGRDVDALGPSDSSDSGSDIRGDKTMSVDSEPGADIRPDRIVGSTGDHDELNDGEGIDIETDDDIDDSHVIEPSGDSGLLPRGDLGLPRDAG